MERSANRRIRTGLTLLTLIIVSASVWYWSVEGLSPVDAVYQTVITISTVGFTELVELRETSRIVTMGVILLGAGTTAYTLTALFEEFAEERIQQARRRRMERSAKGMVDHMIICGYDRLGSRVAQDARRKGGEVAVIEHDPDLCQAAEDAGVTLIRGNATDDATLEAAGVEQAAVLVAALASDADNLYIVLSARTANPKMRIVARAVSSASVPKLERAGADRVVNPEDIGASRLLAVATRPTVSEFLDVVLNEEDVEYEFDAARVGKESQSAGRTLEEADLRKCTGAVVLALRRSDGTFDAQPAEDTVLEPDSTVIGIGTTEQLRSLAVHLDPEGQHQKARRRGEWPYV